MPSASPATIRRASRAILATIWKIGVREKSSHDFFRISWLPGPREIALAGCECYARPVMDSGSAIVEFTRIYLAVFYSGVAAFYALRITAKKRAGSLEVVFPGERYSSTWWNHMLFRGFRFTIWMVCLFRWPFPVIDNYLGIFSALNTWPVVLAGNTLLTIGFLFAIAVHFALGRQWRSGIDPRGPGELRVDGFYRYSRNPMFAGVAVAQVGFLFALPSVFSAVCLVVGLYALRGQALAEEDHLSKRFPEEYARYRSRVGRWL